MEIEIKFYVMDCPDCGQELKNAIGCINSPNNEFNIIELEQSTFECIDCDKQYHIGDIDYFSE